jgi:hypothetical protein
MPLRSVPIGFIAENMPPGSMPESEYMQINLPLVSVQPDPATEVVPVPLASE